MTNKEIGKKMRILRNKKGFTLEKVASLVKSRMQHISAIELGTKSVSDSMLNEILKIYDLEIQRIIKKIKNK